MNTWFLTSFANAINLILALDPASQMRIQKLQGKTITIELLPFHFVFQCVFQDARVNIHSGKPFPSETTLRGTPIQMASVALAKNLRHRFFAEDIVIEGDAALGQDVMQLFDALHIDWQEYLSKLIGDVPTYHMNRLVSHIHTSIRHVNETMLQNVNEYIHEEAQWLPSKEALKDFFNDVDQLRLDLDRTEAKLNAIKNHLTHHKGAA